MRDIVLIDPDEPRAVHWMRAASSAWAYRPVEGIEAEISIEAPPVVLRLADLYEGLTFPPRPRLVTE